MSRPRKNVGERSAYQKISDAFWRLLETEDYNHITVKMITNEAGVNRNTIYYHFDNIDEMARQFFIDEFRETILPNYDLEIVDLSSNKRELVRWQRISLFTCKKSEYLESIIRNELRQYWMRQINAKYEDLAFKDKIQIEFILSGTLTSIAMARESNDPNIISELTETEIGKALHNFFFPQKHN